MAEEDPTADQTPYKEASSNGMPNAGPRPGGQVKGGTAPQDSDPANPKQAAEHVKASNEEMRKRGFGDHKGEDFGGDGTEASGG